MPLLSKKDIQVEGIYSYMPDKGTAFDGRWFT